MKESLKNILKKVKEFCKKHKKRIIITISSCVLLVIVATGAVGALAYSRANANIKYSQEDMEKIALGKVQGEVVDTEKELNFRKSAYEYKFKIKDKDNMLQTVTVDSKYGVIVNDKRSHHGDNERRGEKSKDNKVNKVNRYNG